MRYKFCAFCENRARDTPLRGVYITHFGQIWVKISILRVLHPCRCTDGGEIWHGEWRMEEGTFGPLLRAKFHPHWCNVSPLRGEKPQNRPLSKLNTGRFALRAMLPVITGPFEEDMVKTIWKFWSVLRGCTVAVKLVCVQACSCVYVCVLVFDCVVAGWRMHPVLPCKHVRNHCNAVQYELHWRQTCDKVRAFQWRHMTCLMLSWQQQTPAMFT